MEYLKQASLLILSPECFDEYFLNFNFFDVSCFKASLSTCLGLGIILGSLLVKVPQIVKLYQNKSGEGISISAVSLDLLAVTIYLSYSVVKGFPFTSWGDAMFLAIQTFIIGAQVLYYSDQVGLTAVYSVGYLAVVYVLCSGLTPIQFLWTLQGVNIPILLTGKLAQAVANYKNGHTGQLSAVTLFALFAGSLARIFTSIQETGDVMSIVTYVASSFANAVIVFQLLYYWNVSITKKKVQ